MVTLTQLRDEKTVLLAERKRLDKRIYDLNMSIAEEVERREEKINRQKPIIVRSAAEAGRC